MALSDIIITGAIILQIPVFLFIVWGFLHEDKFIQIEDKIIDRFKYGKRRPLSENEKKEIVLQWCTDNECFIQHKIRPNEDIIRLRNGVGRDNKA